MEINFATTKKPLKAIASKIANSKAEKLSKKKAKRGARGKKKNKGGLDNQVEEDNP